LFAAQAAETDGDWTYVDHDFAGTRYSTLTQITAKNVDQLADSRILSVRGCFGYDVSDRLERRSTASEPHFSGSGLHAVAIAA
jgi:hypothetical protein